MVSGNKDEFNYLQKYLIHNSKQLLLEHQWELNSQSHLVQKGFVQLINNGRSVLDLKIDKIKSQSINKLHLSRESDLPNRLDRLQLSTNNYLTQRRTELNGLNDLLIMLDPQRLLEKGYTISTVDDLDVNQNHAKLKGKTMKTLSSKSMITSEIIDVKKT